MLQFLRQRDSVSAIARRGRCRR